MKKISHRNKTLPIFSRFQFLLLLRLLGQDEPLRGDPAADAQREAQEERRNTLPHGREARYVGQIGCPFGPFRRHFKINSFQKSKNPNYSLFNSARRQ